MNKKIMNDDDIDNIKAVEGDKWWLSTDRLLFFLFHLKIISKMLNRSIEDDDVTEYTKRIRRL